MISFFRRSNTRPTSIIIWDDIPMKTVQQAVNFWCYYWIIDYDLPIDVSPTCDSHFIDGYLSVMQVANMDVEKYYAITYHNHKTSAAELKWLSKNKAVLFTTTDLGGFSQRSYLLHILSPRNKALC